MRASDRHLRNSGRLVVTGGRAMSGVLGMGMLLLVGAPSRAVAMEPIRESHTFAPETEVRVELSVEPSDAEVQFIGRLGEPSAECRGDCSITIPAGTYALYLQPPDGSGLRHIRKEVTLAEDSMVEVEPGSRAGLGWGLGLTIGGGTSVLLGMIMLMQGWLAPSSPRGWSGMALTAGFAGGGGVGLAAGVYLLSTGRNRVRVTPSDPPQRAASMLPQATLGFLF